MEQKTTPIITMGIYDTNAKPSLTMVVNPNDMQPFYTTNTFYSDEIEKRAWATLENNRTILDGKFEPFPDDMDNFDDWGLWGANLSDKNGDFSSPLTFSFSFSTPITSRGITLHFDELGNEWANRVFVQWYSEDDSILDRAQEYPESGKWFINKEVNRYSRISITIYGTNKPERYLKWQGIDFGYLAVFSGENVIYADLYQNINQIGDEVTPGELQARFYSEDDTYNILDPNSITAGLREKQIVRTSMVINGVTKQIGVHYLKKWNSSSENETEIIATDAIGLLDNSNYQGGVFGPDGDSHGQTIRTAGQLIDDILGDIDHYIDPRIESISVDNGWLPTTTKRNALKQVAFACKGIIDTSGDGIIKIYPREERAKHLINYSDKWLGYSRVEKFNTVTGVMVTSYRYTKGSESSRVSVVSDSVYGDTIKSFNQPYHSYQITGGTIRTAHANFVAFTGNGEVEITAIPYLDNASEIKYNNYDIPANIDENIEVYNNFYLVNQEHVNSIADNLLRYHNQNYSIKYRKVLTTDEEIAQTQEVMSYKNQKVRGNVEYRSINLAKGYTGDITVRGYVVTRDWAYYVGELYVGGSGLLL